MVDVALERGGTILVPQIETLRGTSATEEWVGHHVLIPSRKVEGMVQTYSGRFVEHDGRGVRSSTFRAERRRGFPEDRCVRVLWDETETDAQGRSMRVCSVDRPLIGGESPLGQWIPSARTLAAARELMEGDAAELEPTLRKVQADLELMARRLRGDSAGELGAQVREALDRAVEDVLCSSSRFREIYNRATSRVNDLSELIQIFAVDMVHSVLWDRLTVTLTAEDDLYFDLASRYQHVRPANVGVSGEWAAVSLVLPTRRFREMTALTSPVAMLYALQDVKDEIRAAAAAHAGASPAMLTTDDLIPILVFVVILARPRHVASCVAYMSDFVLGSYGTSEVGFNLVSLEAALAYLRSDSLASGIPLPRQSRTRQGSSRLLQRPTPLQAPPPSPPRMVRRASMYR